MIRRATHSIEDIFSPLRQYFQKKSFSRKEIDEKPPLRSEIFTAEQMELYAGQLAQKHRLSFENMPEQLLKRLSENEEVLTRVAGLLHDAVKEKKRISPAGEWLLDNFYLVEEQIVTGKKYLPKGYSKGLPRLTNEHVYGLPRVYDIAIEIISHSDGHVNVKSLRSFIKAYQQHSNLTIGELWAVPIMLRLALLENLSRVSAQIGIDRIDENLADSWAEKLLKAAETDPKSLVLIIADMARSEPPMVGGFVAPLTQRLQWKGAEMAMPVSWLEHQLAEKNTSINALVQSENQQQAADQVSMSNSINSLRFLAKMDWREFVEGMSVTEYFLRSDPAAVYDKMDFNTRDMYRHAVEKMSKKYHVSEEKIASIAIQLAQNAAENEDDRKKHVGFYLTGKGRQLTENEALKKKSRSGRKSEHRFYSRFYIFTALLITVLLTTFLLYKIYAAGNISLGLLVLPGILLLVCCSQFALQVSNWLATLIVKPLPLPRMDFSKGIPFECRTMVVVPSMLVAEGQVNTLVEELEVRFLANRDSNLFFALLTDFGDASQEHLPADDALLQQACSGIEALNEKYAHNDKGCFFLLHRKRLWNRHERKWMGRERKRGKLEELNSLLRGTGGQDFMKIVGNHEIFETIRYVITLDADTQLPREAAWKLAGIMAHPLNRPVINEKKNIVTEGYGIIQPRIAISLHGTVRSHYTVMHENDSGIDPYTKVTSNVYQDVFGEGSYIGKGIYDVDVFEKVLNNRFPDNKILSHDLLEGAYVRCAFASDVQLYEDYPARYRVDMNRRHRWIRGDWQIANWLLPWVRNHRNEWKANPVNALARWKILDNLRRSLVPVALLALLLLGWALPGAPLFWTLVIIGIGLVPSVITSAWDVLRKPQDVQMRYHIQNSARAIYRNISEAAFYLVCLPYEAYTSINAIVRSAWRMLITKRNLLEWNPYGFDQNTQYTNLLQVYCSMWPATVISVASFGYMLWHHPYVILLASPFLIAWFLSPAIVWWLGFPLKDSAGELSASQQITLRKLSRKTWSFYENFVGPEDNWLPPDNFQQHPVTVLAHRTSPTNIGMALLANLAAHDFGYISLNILEERCRLSFAAMQKLERYAGHLYNWYDTVSMQPLYPRYISVVDSGNLGGHLLVLKQGLLQAVHQPLLRVQHIHGLIDVIHILCESSSASVTTGLSKLAAELQSFIDAADDNIDAFKKSVDYCAAQFDELFNNLNNKEKTELYWWAEAFKKQVSDLQETIQYFAPCLSDAQESNHYPQEIPSLHSLAALLQAEESTPLSPLMKMAALRANEKLQQLKQLIASCEDFSNMSYDFLYDDSQHLFSIGYNVEEHKRDASCYDLLASEARLASFLAIAQGKVPQENWFALGRRLTNTGGNSVLLSWSGSMFEYLMPNLVMPAYDNTLLDHSNKGAVRRQIEYGRQMGTAWGISESCYNVVDAHLNYQYRAFGVPGLGFKRGLGDDHVIAPYASVMALMVDPVAACENIERMIQKGYQGKYGFYEAVDFTAVRLPRNQDHVVIQTFMVHHLGMSLLSLAYTLLDKPMQKRFEAEPQFQATLLLLQEQIPKVANYYSGVSEAAEVMLSSAIPEMRVIKTPHTPVPEVQLLSNGRYHVMLSNTGGGYSRWKNKAVTRWREDATCDNWGSFCYIQDVENGIFWSNTYQPAGKETKLYEAVFSQGRAEYKRIDNGIETHTEVIVSPEDDVEIRRVTLTNRTAKKRRIAITSYAEVVLNNAAADDSHPAFNNLFVQTEIIESQQAIACTRRPRSAEEQEPWMYHIIKTRHYKESDVSYETDRSRFTGRGNTLVNPAAMQTAALSNTQGSVLDPIVSIRYVFELKEDETFSFDMLTGVVNTKEECHTMIDKYQDRQMRDRAFELSWTHSQVILRQINASEADAQLFGKMAGSVVYSNPYLRAEQSILIRNRRGQSSLWGYSISGDLPIVLLQISANENMDLVKQMIQARAYWQLKGLSVDLFIWNEDESGYRQVLQEQIQNIISTGNNFITTGNQGAVFVRPAEQISPEDRILLQTVARVIISDKKGSLADQLNKKKPLLNIIPYINAGNLPQNKMAVDEPLAMPALEYFNGMGGFAPEGHEYIIKTGSQNTPAPWANIIANAQMGCVLSERGASYTWYENAHEYRLTPWHNDPVSDTAGEAFYIRDEKTGSYWSPAPFAAQGRNEYIVKHGFGYSVFEYAEQGIASDMEIFIDTEEAIKFFIINIHNRSNSDKKLSVTGYMEWVLGALPSKTGMHIITEADVATGALYAYNPYNTEFEGRVCFFDCSESSKNFTAHRTEFIGRNGSLQFPDAMKRIRLSGKTGAGFDSCAAIQTVFDLPAGGSKQIIFKLGAAKNMYEARTLAAKFRENNIAHAALQKLHHQWETLLHNVTVHTPDRAFNLLCNGWLLYQTIACRLWGRSGFYQSGGAFGFRDQLQDTLAALHANPALTREQLLLAASRQFKEGDVQHWWHPPMGRGVRTHCSDDYLWLPYVTAKYLQHTGDTAVLDEIVGFLEGRPVNANEESYYDLPNISPDKASLYEHCKLAVKHGFRYGVHGLPLIGAGDWNDGMNMVGKEGKGESVWLAFFLYDVLQKFIEVSRIKNDAEFISECEAQAVFLKEQIHQNAWDGNWYIRAFFDDGTPIGSAQNEECKIDSISQSWAVLSGAGSEERIKIAMASLQKYLVKESAGLIQLLEPPFDKSSIDPGYIKGYVPGVRENGGQYTHAAVWTVMAFAKMKERQTAWDLLQMISPVQHTSTQQQVALYKAEPYVMAADVYGVAPHTGRGGWTWYTGSAGWYYQLMIEWIAGLRVKGNRLFFEPCVPHQWNEFNIRYRYGNTMYHINLQRGQPMQDSSILLTDDGGEHSITVYYN